MYILEKFNEKIGIDMTNALDQISEYIKWPDIIGFFCYSCFGKKYRLEEVILDVSLIEEAGSAISHSFNNTMPLYMKPAIPLGSMAMNFLDKAIS
jgi:hypothetical protein